MKYPKPSPSFSERELPLPPNRGTLCWFSPGGPKRAHPIQESGTIVNFFPPTRTDEPQKPQSLGRSHVQVPPIQAQRCPGHMAPPPPTPQEGKARPSFHLPPNRADCEAVAGEGYVGTYACGAGSTHPVTHSLSQPHTHAHTGDIPDQTVSL